MIKNNVASHESYETGALTAANAKAMIEHLLDQQGKSAAMPMPQFDNQGYFKKQNQNEKGQAVGPSLTEFVNKKNLLSRRE